MTLPLLLNQLQTQRLLIYLRITIDSTLYGNQRDEELDDEETDVNSVAI